MESINIINAATARNVDVGINNKHVQVSRFEQYSYGHDDKYTRGEKSQTQGRQNSSATGPMVPLSRGDKKGFCTVVVVQESRCLGAKASENTCTRCAAP